MAPVRTFLAALLLPVLFAGCNDPSVGTPYLKQTDSLLVRLDSSAKYLYKIDTSALKNTMKLCKERVLQLGALKTERADSLAREYGHKYRIYKHFLKKYPKLNKEVETSKGQLHDLRHDLRYQLLEKGKDSLYYTQERKALNRLRREISLYYQRILEQNRQITRLNNAAEQIPTTDK